MSKCQMISGNKLAYDMQSHDLNSFCKEINIQIKSKSTLSNCVDGITGKADIANEWKNRIS